MKCPGSVDLASSPDRQGSAVLYTGPGDRAFPPCRRPQVGVSNGYTCLAPAITVHSPPDAKAPNPRLLLAAVRLPRRQTSAPTIDGDDMDLKVKIRLRSLRRPRPQGPPSSRPCLYATLVLKLKQQYVPFNSLKLCDRSCLANQA